MIRPLQITFQNVEPSAAVEARIRSEVAKLDKYYERITSCRVVVEKPHRHHKRGEPFHLRIDLDVPGTEIVVKHTPSVCKGIAHTDTGKWSKDLGPDRNYKDIYVSIGDAFGAVRRRLEDHVRRLRGDVKIHARVPPFRKDKLRAENLAGI